MDWAYIHSGRASGNKHHSCCHSSGCSLDGNRLYLDVARQVNVDSNLDRPHH